MPKPQTYHGIYLPDSDGEPIALFRYADQAQQIRKTFYGTHGAVAPVDLDVPRHDEMAELLATSTASDGEAQTSSGEEALRAQIRAEVQQERTRERLRREIEAELDEQERGGATVELREPAVSGTAPSTDPERDAGGGTLDPDKPSNPELGQIADHDAAAVGERHPDAGSDEVIPGVTVAQRDALVAAGFKTPADIRDATDEQLDAVEGIGPETVKRLREATKA